MSPTPDGDIEAAVSASPLLARYGTALDRDSARELLTEQLEGARREAEAERVKAEADEEFRRQQEEIAKDHARQERQDRSRSGTGRSRSAGRTTSTRRQTERSPLEEILRSPVTKTILTGVVTGIFGTRRRRR